MDEPDVKPHHQDDEILVTDVTEMLDDGPQECEMDPPDPDPCPGTESAENASQSSSSSSMLQNLSRNDVISILGQIGQPLVALPQSNSRLYAVRSAMKKMIKMYTVNKLRPQKPTKMCRRFLYYRAPYRNSLISFDKVRAKHMILTKSNQMHRQEAAGDVTALPVCFDDYVTQIETLYHILLVSEGLPEDKSDRDMDVTDIRKYKAHLLSEINALISDAVISTKSHSADIPGTICPSSGRGQFEIQTDDTTDIRVGFKIIVKISDEEFFGDVVSFLRHGERTFIQVTLPSLTEQVSERDTVCHIRPVALVGHLMFQAKAVMSLESFPIHREFLDPVMTSLNSGIGVEFSKSFFSFYTKTTDFYTDSVQKVIDTLALNQADVSHICVVDDYDTKNLSEFLVDSVLLVLKNKTAIIDQLRAITEIQSDDEANNDDLNSLNLVIISKCKRTLDDVMKELGKNKISFYSDQIFSSEIVDFLSVKSDPEAIRIRNLIADSKFSGIEREHAKKSGRERLLQSCPIIVGNIPDLLNDEFVRNMLMNKSRVFDAAIVHEATSFSESELLSLLLSTLR